MASSKEVAVKPDGPTIDPDLIFKASKALLAHMKKASKEKAANAEKKNLLATSDDEEAFGDQDIWLTLSTKRHIAESRSLKPGKIPLPHPLRTDPEMSICLITAEPQRAYKNLVASPDFPAEWRKRVTRVIDIGKLKSKYRSYESQRKLAAEHDVFLGDARIVNRLPQALGKSFYKTTAKRPIPVDIQARVPKNADGKQPSRKTKGNNNAASDGTTVVNACTPAQLAGEVERAVGAALVNLSPSAHTAVRVARAGWPAERVAANVGAAARALVERFVPGRWGNVRGLYVKGPETAALPVWLTEELWLEEGKDVVADGSDEAKAASASAEKPNIGKKRKSLDEEAEPAEGDQDQDQDQEQRKKKKVKKSKTRSSSTSAAAVPEGDDAKLDKEIAERKASLKKQKKAAKKALEV